MKKLAIVSMLVLGGFAVQAQTKPNAKVGVKKETAKAKDEHCKTGKSCCKNEKALSALRRPVAKPLTSTKKS